MKIIFLSKYQNKVERGVENYVSELASRLKKLGNKVEVLTSFWQLPRFDLPRSDFTIIYPLNGYWQTLGCRLYAWLTGAKLVVGGHAGIGRDDRWNLYMFPDLFIAFSKKGEEWAKKANPFAKVVKIPHGVNIDWGGDSGTFFSGDARLRDITSGAGRLKPRSLKVRPIRELVSNSSLDVTGSLFPGKKAPSSPSVSFVSKITSSGQPLDSVKLDLERPVFVTAAHLEPYKRIDLTVKAVAELERGSLLVLGEGPMETEIDELGERLLGKKRYLRLVVPHKQVAGYLRAADVFTLVSEESEAFGLVYLEAMACGLPVVATDDSLRRELVEGHAAIRLSAESRRAGAGVFVKNPEDSKEYARCLEAAAKTEWGDKPVKQAKKFDWEKIAERYLEEFKGI